MIDQTQIDSLFGCDKKYLVTDSRSVFDPDNTIFAAIRTDIGDGHRFVRPLIDKGVSTFVVEYIPDNCSADEADFVVVDSVEEALSRIAARRIAGHRNGIIVTGSRGKTTVKEMIYRTLLSQGIAVRRSPGSWNSAVGVALSLWENGIAPEDCVIVTEAAIDGPGQARRISELTRETHPVGVITDITDEHDEAFENHAAKVREKIALVEHCRVIVYNDSDPELGNMLREVCPAAQLIPVSASCLPEDCTTVYHALVKAALNLDCMPSLPYVSTRVDITETTGGNTVLRDHFTPDLRALRNTLDTMRRHLTEVQTPVLILGPLVEGSHRQAIELANRFGVDNVITVDNAAEFASAHTIENFANNLIVVFGPTENGFDEIASSLRSAAHDTTLEVDLDALAHNYNAYRSLLPKNTGLIAMVKANAYGVGASEVGKTLQTRGAAALAVAVIDEGVALRKAGLSLPVIVLNPVTNRYPSLFANRLEPAVFSVEELDRLIKEAAKLDLHSYPVHVKLDTGMHRVGFTEEQLKNLIERMQRPDADRVKIVSVFSHLATADCLDLDSYTAGQLRLFKTMCETLATGLRTEFKRHILNTAGMVRYGKTEKYEMARLGIGLYGISPVDVANAPKLKPVAAFRSTIISLKHLDAGMAVGYGCKGRVERPSVIATLPVGYADGVNRHFGCGAVCFKIRGVECPTIGNICMDLCMVDVTDVPGVAVGDSVEIFGPEMPVERLSHVLGTIPYEVLTSVSARVMRTYFKR